MFAVGAAIGKAIIPLPWGNRNFRSLLPMEGKSADNVRMKDHWPAETNPGAAKPDAMPLEAVRFGRIQELFGRNLASFCREYLDDSWRHFETLLDSSGRHNFESKAISAHSLKGSAANIGAERLSSLAEHLENKLKDGEPPSRPELEAIGAELRHVDAAVRAAIAANHESPLAPEGALEPPSAERCRLRRIATEEERARYHEIRKRELFDVYHPDMPYDPRHPDEVKENNHALGFYYQNRMVGVIRIDLLGKDRAAFRAVAIDGEWQNRGLGAILLELAEQYAARLGRKKLLLHINRRAVNFYRRNGYAEVADWGNKLDPNSLSFGKSIG